MCHCGSAAWLGDWESDNIRGACWAGWWVTPWYWERRSRSGDPEPELGKDSIHRRESVKAVMRDRIYTRAMKIIKAPWRNRLFQVWDRESAPETYFYFRKKVLKEQWEHVKKERTASLNEFKLITSRNNLRFRINDKYQWIIPCRRKWQPSLVFLPEEFHGQRNLEGYSPWGHKVRHNWVTKKHTHIIGLWATEQKMETENPCYKKNKFINSLKRKGYFIDSE